MNPAASTARYTLSRRSVPFHASKAFRPTWLVPAAALLLLALPAQIAAQDLTPSTESTDEAEDVFILSEFTVAAEKTVEKSVQKTSISLSVIGEDMLQVNQVSDATGLSNYVPNLQISRSTNAVEIAIRGIGSTNNTEVGDPAAGFAVDGIAYARPEAAGVSFYDVQRVEVLRGPQGTLYGRNTIAGSVNVVTNKPQPVFAGSGSISYGNYNAFQFDGMINVPLNKWAAMRASFFAQSHDGYWDGKNRPAGILDDLGWSETKSARVHLLLTPVEDFSALFTVQASDVDGTWNPFVMRPLDGSEPRRGFVTDVPNSQNEHYVTFSTEITKRIGDIAATYLGSYSREDIDQNIAAALSPLPNPFILGGPNFNYHRQQTHELRFSTAKPDRLEWVAGLYYFRETNDVTLLLPSFGLAFLQPDVLSESKAAFTHFSYKLTDSFRLVGGLRYNKDHKARTGGQFAVDSDGQVGDRLSLNDADREWNSTNWKAGLEYDIGARSMLYGTASTGYKAGGFYDGTGDVYYQPEEITSYELGWKNRLLENRLQVNVAAFYYDYTNFQVSSAEINPVTNELGTVTRNIGKMPIQGVELETNFQISRGDRLDLSVSHLDSEFKDFIVGATEVDGTFVVRDLSGNELAKAPNWTVQFSYSKTFTLANRGTVTCRVNSRWVDGYYLSFDNHPIAPHPVDTRQPSFTTSDFIATYENPNRSWYCSLYFKNIEDKTVMVSTGGNASGDVAVLAAPFT